MPDRNLVTAPRPDDRAQRIQLHRFDNEGAEHGSFIQVVLRHKWIIVLGVFLGGLLAFGLTVRQTRMYQAHTSLEFSGLNENVLNSKEMDPTATADNSSQAYINTQSRVLQSTPLLERVVAKVKAENLAGPLAGGERKRKALANLTVAGVSRGLQTRTSELNRLIDVSVDSPDPDIAAQIANAIGDEYITQSLEAKWQAAQRTSGWLAKQLDEMRTKLEKSESALQDYARRTNLVFAGEQGSVSEARLRQLQEEYSRAQADRVAKQSIYEGLSGESPEALTAALKDTALQDYQMKLSELNRQEADLAAVYESGNAKLQRVRSQIAELRKDYSRQHDAAQARVKYDFQTARRREEMLAGAYKSQEQLVTQDAGKAVDYNILKREAETNRAIYEAMMQKVKSYSVASAMQPSNVRVVDPAETPLFPHSPNVPMTTMFGMMGGLFMSLIWVGVRDKGQITVEYPGQTKQMSQAPELGVIPAAKLDPSLSKRADSGAIGSPGESGVATFPTKLSVIKRSVETATWHHKSSLLAESVRSIRTSILVSHEQAAPQVVVVTSLNPAHGKTSVVSNLGIALAEVGKRVLLIDADLRSPALHKVFGLGNESGLSSALRAAVPVDEYDLTKLIRPAGIPSLWLLPSGHYATGSSSSTLLHSDRMSQLLQRLRTDFDAILIDTPPLALSDARILGPLSDGVILVLRAGDVRLDSLLAAEERLVEDGSRVIGTILNNWDPRSNGYGSYPDRYYKGSYFEAASA